MWRACNAAGRPWPILDEDDVIDYMVLEAVAAKATKMEQDAQEKQKREAWKKDTSNLEQHR
jgi:hypothetical protein